MTLATTVMTFLLCTTRRIRLAASEAYSKLKPTQATAAAVQVSSGTELLIYRGDFDVTDAPLDATIEGLADSSLSYPMPYGYSLVGTG